ncbi:MAG TPA: 3D domain-containing protein, partial [Phenylobacterium sp.]|nr:3D domain-containing protein [Phenylobacterium sp.]
GVPLPPEHAIAVDLSRHALGTLFWIEAQAPILTGAFPTYNQLALALDTGGAIQGPVRADLYLGSGPEAGVEAGRVRHTLSMVRLAPRVGPDLAP